MRSSLKNICFQLFTVSSAHHSSVESHLRFLPLCHVIWKSRCSDMIRNNITFLQKFIWEIETPILSLQIRFGQNQMCKIRHISKTYHQTNIYSFHSYPQFNMTDFVLLQKCLHFSFFLLRIYLPYTLYLTYLPCRISHLECLLQYSICFDWLRFRIPPSPPHILQVFLVFLEIF